jgi:hypothetical protein
MGARGAREQEAAAAAAAARSRGLIEACASGACAAIGAVCGKVALGDAGAELAAAELAAAWTGDAQEAAPWPVELALRATCLAAMVTINALMVRFYVRALSAAGTLLATATNTAVNTAMSSALGAWLFGEPLSVTWAQGVLLLLLGVVLLRAAEGRGSAEPSESTAKRR